MNKTTDPLADLTAERSLFALYFATRRLRTRPLYHVTVLGAFALVFAATLACSPAQAALSQQVRELSNLVFQFAGAILGIVIGGFAIFSMIAASEVAGLLALAVRSDTGQSELKALALHFVAAFVPFLAFIAVHWAIGAFGWPNGPASHLLALAPADNRILIVAAIFSFICSYFVALLLVLQSLVFNVYIAFMTIARGTVELAQLKLLENELRERTRASAQADGEQ